MTGDSTIKKAADKADDAATSAADSKWFERAARVGFVANGLVHIILGATSVGLALGRGGEAEQSGAMQQMAAQPFGMVLLWLCMLGCALLALWNLINAFFGTASLRGHGSSDPRDKDGRSNWKEFVLAIAQGIAYAAVAVLFGKFAFGQGSDSGQSSSQASSTLAQAPGGILLLILIGAVIAIIGIVFCVNGIRRKWKDDARPPRSRGVGKLLTVTGVVGYLGKGATLLAVGILVIVSGVAGDPEKSTGVDGALKAMRDQPFGSILLLCVGVGLVLYGVFLFLRARYDKMD